MKTISLLGILVLSLNAFGASKCPNIEGFYIAKENDSAWAIEMKDNVISSSNFDSIGPGLILDGQEHPFHFGGKYTASCKRNEIKMTTSSSDVSYELLIKKGLFGGLVISEKFTVDGKNGQEKYTLKKLSE